MELTLLILMAQVFLVFIHFFSVSNDILVPKGVTYEAYVEKKVSTPVDIFSEFDNLNGILLSTDAVSLTFSRWFWNRIKLIYLKFCDEFLFQYFQILNSQNSLEQNK